jgi:hypothetical protein
MIPGEDELTDSTDDVLEPEPLSEAAVTALFAFNEDARRVAKAYHLLLEADRQLLIAPAFRSLDDLQHDLVDATNNYHRALYGNLGAFVKYVRIAAPKTLQVRNGHKMPHRSMEKWLKWVAEQFPFVGHLVERIEQSRRFRVDFIDHPQMDDRAHTWATFGLDHDVWGWITAIVYYSYRLEDGPPQNQEAPAVVDPFQPGWVPFWTHETFMVAPEYRLLQYSWETLTNVLLAMIRNEVHGAFDDDGDAKAPSE